MKATAFIMLALLISGAIISLIIEIRDRRK